MMRIIFLILLTALLFSSCSRDELKEVIEPIALDKIGELDGLERGDCFDFVYPVTYVMPDGSKITVEDESGLQDLRSWYETHPDVSERPAFQYPMNVTFRYGTLVKANDMEDLRRIYAGCGEEETEASSCFDFVYPITYLMPDLSKITIEKKEDFELLRKWHFENPDAEGSTLLEFPVNIVSPDGSSSTINDQEELEFAIRSCGEEEACFQLVYPVVYVMPDGSLIPVDFAEAAEGEFARWYSENPDIDDPPVLRFPVDIKFEDGTLQTVSNYGELRVAYAECD